MNGQTAPTLEELAMQYIEEETKTLREILDIVAMATEVKLVNGSVVTEMKLSNSDLETFCLRIPAECAFLQSKVSHFNIRQVFRDLEIENDITNSIKSFNGKGNAAERMRYAEQLEYDKIASNTVNKTVSKGIQNQVERADKVYEAIKKVLDFRAREAWFDRK